MREMRWVALGIALVLGCQRTTATEGGDGGGALRAGPSRIGSCDRGQSTGTCSEYAGTYLEQNQLLLTSSCSKLGGTFVYAECPNTSVVGACTLSTTEVRKFYGTGAAAYEADRAKSECEKSFRGTWVAH